MAGKVVEAVAPVDEDSGISFTSSTGVANI